MEFPATRKVIEKMLINYCSCFKFHRNIVKKHSKLHLICLIRYKNFFLIYPKLKITLCFLKIENLSARVFSERDIPAEKYGQYEQVFILNSFHLRIPSNNQKQTLTNIIK